MRHAETGVDILTFILTFGHGFTLETPELALLDGLLHRRDGQAGETLHEAGRQKTGDEGGGGV